MKELWVEKYRPKTVDGYVFRDEHQKKQVQQWIKEETIPHLLFSGFISDQFLPPSWFTLNLPNLVSLNSFEILFI